MAKSRKDLLFVCYSHTDTTYKERLQKFLTGGGLPETLDIFSDTAIKPGEEWQPKIMEKLRQATAALVLVSQDFMISPFIQQVEMRDLLVAQAQRGLRLFLVPVRATYYDGTYLQKFQWARPPNKPLSSLPEQEQEAAMVEVCRLVASELAKPVDSVMIENTVHCLESVPRLDLPAFYELQGAVGEGDYARCFLARDRMLDRDVIIKVLHEELSRESEAYDRYVRSVAKLHHRGILGVLFSQTSKLPHFIVTSSVPETLLDRMKHSRGKKAPTLEQIVHWLLQIADALHFAHTHGCVHARLRASEVRLDGNEPILSGFRTLKHGVADCSFAPASKTTLDDFWCASPEMRRTGRVTPLADQYLLGLLAYELISGGRPVPLSSWDSLLDPQVLEAIQNPRPLHEVAKNCSKDISDVIMRSLETDPRRRWKDVAEFAEHLKNAQCDRSRFVAAKASYRRCSQSPDFYRTIYDRLFEKMPKARAMFRNVTLERQYDVLRDAMWLLLKFPSSGDNDEPTILSRVARTHARITAEQYDLFRDAILEAVREHDSPSAVQDWRAAMAQGFDYLKRQVDGQRLVEVSRSPHPGAKSTPQSADANPASRPTTAPPRARTHERSRSSPGRS